MISGRREHFRAMHAYLGRRCKSVSSVGLDAVLEGKTPMAIVFIPHFGL